jgi:hypothetical protein
LIERSSVSGQGANTVRGRRPDCDYPGSKATRQIVVGTGIVFGSDGSQQGHPGPVETGIRRPRIIRGINFSGVRQIKKFLRLTALMKCIVID